MAGAAYYSDTEKDIEASAELRAGQADAIYLGAIGLPTVRALDGTEIAPHLRLREQFELYAGLRPVRAYKGAPLALSDSRAKALDLIIIRESTEGLFYTAAVHNRSPKTNADEAHETLRLTRSVTERLCDFAFTVAERRKARGKKGEVTCVDKANVFKAFAFFRQIFDERAANFLTLQPGTITLMRRLLIWLRNPGILMFSLWRICLGIFYQIYQAVWSAAWGWLLQQK